MCLFYCVIFYYIILFRISVVLLFIILKKPPQKIIRYWLDGYFLFQMKEINNK